MWLFCSPLPAFPGRGIGYQASTEHPMKYRGCGFSSEFGVWEGEGFGIPRQQDWKEPIWDPLVCDSPVFSESSSW